MIKFVKNLFRRKSFNNLFGRKKKDRFLTSIPEDKIEDNKIIKEQAKYIQSLEAQLSKKDAKERQKKVKQKNIQDDIDLIKELEKKQIEIDKKPFKNSYNIGKLFSKLVKDKKFAKTLEIVDKDDNRVFDIFKTFKILNNGEIAIQGKSGEIWAHGPTLNHIIFKPETLKNQIKRKRILLPYDKNFNFIPDLEKWTIPEISYDERDNSYHESEERKIYIKDKFIELDKENRKLKEDKEHKEQVIADLRNKLQDVELAKKSWKSQAENSQSELSIALENGREAINKIGELHRNLATAQGQKLLSDKINDIYDDAFEKILKELEDEKAQTTLRRIRDEVQTDVEWAKKQFPVEKHTTIIESKEEEEKEEQNKKQPTQR